MFLALIAGCKSTQLSNPHSGGTDLDYKTQKVFEKAYFEANKQKVLNNKEEALKGYMSALEINPKSHAAMYQCAKLLYQLEKFPEALSYAQQAVKTSPKYNHWYYGQLAQFYSKFGKYEQSADVFSEMVLYEPGERSNYTEGASQYYNAKKYDRAEALLRQMQTKFGIERESSTRLDFIYSATNQRNKAVEVMEQLSETYPDDLQFKGYLSETYMRAGLEKKAIVVLQEILEQDSSVGKAYFALYTIHNEAGRDEQAMLYLKHAFTTDDITLQQKLQAVSSYFNGLKRDENTKTDILELSDILLENYSTDVEPYVLRADIYATLNDFNKAREYTRQAITKDPSNYGLWGKLLNANLRLGDSKQQVVDVEEALMLFPNVPELYINLGFAYLDLSNLNKALETADEGLEIALEKSDKAQLYLCKATVFGRQGKHDKEDEVFEKILNIHPFNSTVLNNYAFSLAERKIELPKADSLINIALRLEPSNPFFLDTKGWVYYARGEYQMAIKLLEKCIAIDPKNPEYYRHARAVYEALGNQSMVNEMNRKLEELDDQERSNSTFHIFSSSGRLQIQKDSK
jgi:tetratricopeptide (TPR) repeat protein